MAKLRLEEPEITTGGWREDCLIKALISDKYSLWIKRVKVTKVFR